jgi:hypothetical protein
MAEDLAPEEGELAYQPGLALGFLICTPLFLAYELGLQYAPQGVGRNDCERLFGALLQPFAERAVYARWGILLALGVWAYVRVRRQGIDLRAKAWRSLLEGVVGAFLLGPILIWMLSFFDAELFAGVSLGSPANAPGIWSAMRLVGGAPWEELLFRVGVFGILYLLLARIGGFFGLGRRAALFLGDLGGIVGSSLAFAAFHLEAVQGALGGVGEPYDAGAFLWRLLAGLLLAGIYRWRGLGTAACAHGFFNVGLALGAGPGIFLNL